MNFKWFMSAKPVKKEEELTIAMVLIALVKVLIKKKLVTNEELYREAAKVKRHADEP